MASDTGTGWGNAGGEQEDGTSQKEARYELLAWVKASDHRQDILTTLQEGPENTTHFKEKWDVATADVPRRYINELQSRELVKCLTPDRQRYRLYGLTEDGEDLVEGL